MTAGIKLSKEKIKDSLILTHGNYMLTAKMLKCSREAIRVRVKADEELSQIVRDEREGIVDVAESALNQAVLRGEPWAIQFTLRSIGRNRGYGDSLQVSGEVKVSDLSDEELESKVREIIDSKT